MEQTNQNAKHYLQIWLSIVIFLVFAMVALGGLTRLTDSGLSITEWKPVTGILPPLSEADWLLEFGKYQTIPEYQIVNKGMSLEAFKYIYWWEWSHRLLGRVIGLAFALPFLVFWLKGYFNTKRTWQMLGLLALGGAQGLMGWVMVKSGLTDGRIDVAPLRLALHLLLATLILCLLYKMKLSLKQANKQTFWQKAFLVTLWLQIFLGGLVAGSHAGQIYQTWPLIDGHFVPPLESLLFKSPLWLNFYENHLTVQFVHRSVAYVLWVWSALLLFQNWNSTNRKLNVVLFAALTAQAVLGILTLLHAVPLPLAFVHQLFAMVVALIASHPYSKGTLHAQ